MRSEEPRSGYLLTLPWVPSGIGGVNQVVANLYDALRADRGFVPRILTTSWDAFVPREDVDAAGRSLIHCRIRGVPVAGPFWWNLAKYLLTLPRDLGRLRRLIRQYRVAVVNCHFIGQSEITWAIAKRLGLFRGTLLLSVHGLDGRTLATLSGVHRRLWRWTLRQADRIVACSTDLARETIRTFDLPEQQVATIHNGVDAAGIAAMGDRGAVPRPARDGGPTVLNLGTFEYKKGHDVLLQAFKIVLTCYPEAQLTIMGRRGETAESTARLVSDLGIAHRVSLQENVPHERAMRALGAADLFVLASRNEAFAVVLLEAGAMGKPIVATDVCGVSEVIEDGVTGIVVPPENAAALAAGMLRALGDREGAAALGGTLQRVVVGKFTAAETCRAYLQLAGCA